MRRPWFTKRRDVSQRIGPVEAAAEQADVAACTQSRSLPDACLRLWRHRNVPKIPSDHAAEIRLWLVAHGFHKTELGAGRPEQWFLGECGVRLYHRDNGCRVKILHSGTGAGWRDLDELINMRRTWPEALTMSAIELATSPQLHVHRAGSAFLRAPGDWIYRHWKPWAYLVKILLQMVVGVGAVVDIGLHVAHSVQHHIGQAPLAPPTVASVKVIAYALAVAAAIELAYTLFTPGPDEALDPLMLGLSSAILLLVTADKNKSLPVVEQFTGVLLGVIALGALFLIRRHLLRDEDQ